MEFRDGKKSGISREWFPAGALRKEEAYAFDALHGLSREWDESGALKTECVYELGVCLRKQERSVDGGVTSEAVLAEDSPQYEILRRLRASTIGQLVNKT